MTMLTVACLVFSGAPTASAHAILVESSPKHEETVVAPRRLTLRFNSRLEKRLCSVSLIGPGQWTILLLAQEPDAPGDTLSFRLPILRSGSYRAKWKVLSSDGHVTEGAVVFSVREAAR
jgi:methionine-rich copper-binding protein CopC